MEHGEDGAVRFGGWRGACERCARRVSGRIGGRVAAGFEGPLHARFGGREAGDRGRRMEGREGGDWGRWGQAGPTTVELLAAMMKSQVV